MNPWYQDREKLLEAAAHYGTWNECAKATGASERSLFRWARRLDVHILGAQKTKTSGLLTPEILKRFLGSASIPRTVEELADHFDCAPKRVFESLDELRKEHVLLNVTANTVALERELAPNPAPAMIDLSAHQEVEYPIGFVCDNHLGSNYERLDVLESLFDRFASYGVETVYQGGNIIDGECHFNKFEIYVHGVEAQVSNLVKKWPKRPGIVTHFVTGDDHEGWYVQREHLNIGQKIEDEARRAGRLDLIHLGYMERDIEYEQPGGNATVRIIHAGGGSSYATSYTSQKYVETLQGGEKPKIVLVGHYHKLSYEYPREVHVIQGGCTQDQTPFMRKHKLQAMVGGVVLWLKQNDIGVFTSIKVEFLPYYDKKFYTYKWNKVEG